MSRYAIRVPEEWPERLLDVMADMAQHSRRFADVASRVYENLTLMSGIGQAGFLFDTGRSPLRLTGRLVVLDLAPFWRSDVPTELRPAREAFVYLAVAAAREFCTREGFSVLVVDDAESLVLGHTTAWQLVVDHIRHSQYRNSAVWLTAVHSQVLRFDRPFLDSYIPQQLLFAPKTRASWQTPPVHPEPVAKLGVGECLWRDNSGRVRRMVVAAASPPLTPTTPR